MWAAIISALAVIVTSTGAILLTKKKEREADWRRVKLKYYESFIKAQGFLAGDKTSKKALIEYAAAANNLNLIAPMGVIRALHDMNEAISPISPNYLPQEQHDQLLSKLIWEIRNDLGDPPTDTHESFRTRLTSAG